MPRYKFSWTNLDERLLRGLVRDLDLDATDPAASLRSCYGARPTDDFVRDSWAALREQWLAKDGPTRRSVSLPSNLFYSTSIPACVLVFRADKPVERRNHLLFVDGSQRFAKGRNQNQMSPADVDAIVAAYRTGDDPDDEGGVNVRLVPFDEIKGNGFDLNIGRYLKTAAADGLDLATALANYEEARARRLEAEHAVFARFAAAGIADLGVHP